jgi:DNA primase
MAKRPYVKFAEIKERIRIADVLQVLGLADQFKRSGETLTGVCPFPSHVHGPMPNGEQFKIGHKDGVDVWHCFGDCQRGGDVIEFMKAMTGLDNAHVRFWFAEKFPDRLSLEKGKGTAGENKPPPAPQSPARPTGGPGEVGPSPETPSAETTPAPPPAVTVLDPLTPLRFHLNLDPSVPYLRERGLTPETIQRFGLGLCRKGVLAGYVAIPIHDYPADHLVAYLGRWPGEDYDEAAGKPRYRWPKGFAASRVVYGLKQALEGTEGQPLIVVEGAFKVFHLYQAGFPNAVSCFSASLSEEQAALLASTERHITLYFDGNEAGYQGMRAAAGKLITRTFVRVVKLPAGCEADDLARDDLRKLLMF